MTSSIEIVSADPEVSAGLLREYRDTLVAPQDDMWAAFAAMASPFMLRREGELVGCFSVNDEGELHRFYVRPAVEDQAGELLEQVVAQHAIKAAMPSTVDPTFLSLCMDRSQGVEVKALMYQHVVDGGPVKVPITSMRLAVEADFDSLVAFERAATGAPLEFLNAYISARISAGELRMHEVNGEIAGIGELRDDGVNAGYAHLGVIVGEASRGQGLGTSIMSYLVQEASRQGLTPLCSTDPSNVGAQRVIERVGFRARHRVLRVALSPRTNASS